MADGTNDLLADQILIARAAAPTRPSLRLASVTGADGAAIHVETDRFRALRWAEALSPDGTIKSIQGQFDTIPGTVFPRVFGYSMTFGEGPLPYLRLSITASWRERAIGFGVASLMQPEPPRYAGLTISALGAATNGHIHAAAVAHDGTEPHRVDREILSDKSPSAELANIIPIPIDELFNEEFTRAQYFGALLSRIRTLAGSRRFAQLGSLAASDDQLWAAALYFGQKTEIPLAGPVPRSFSEIRDNATQAKRWFNAIAWFDAAIIGAVNPIAGAFAAGGAAWTGDAFNSFVDQNLARLEGSAPDAGAPDAGAPDAGAPDAGAPDAGGPDAGGGVDAGGGGGGGGAGGGDHEPGTEEELL